MTGEQEKRATVDEARAVMQVKWGEYESEQCQQAFDRDLAAFEAAVREDERARAGRVVRAFDKQFPPDGVGAPQSIADYDEDELNAIFDQLARTFYVERGIRSSDIHLSEEQP